jgi:hypothetical protein
MIQEAYVSLELAKMMAKAGFSDRCRCYYLGDEPSRWTHAYQEVIPKDVPVYECPTQQVAMRWLREEHKINIEVRMLFDSWDFCVQRIPNHEGAIYQAEDIWKSYEAACNAALYYCVDNLIED